MSTSPTPTSFDKGHVVDQLAADELDGFEKHLAVDLDGDHNKTLDDVSPTNHHHQLDTSDPLAQDATSKPAAPGFFRIVLLGPRAVWSYLFDRDANIHLVGLVLMFYFIGFGPLQSLQTIRYPALGSYNLAVLYGVYAVNSLLAPFYIEIIGPAAAVTLAGCFMMVFPFTLWSGNNGVALLGAASHGFGTGFLWVGAGRIIASISTNQDEATNSAIFLTYNSLASVIGGLTYAVLSLPQNHFNTRADWSYQYAIWAGCEFTGVLIGVILCFNYRRTMRRKDELLSREVHQKIEELTAAGRTEDAIRMRESLKKKKLDIRATARRVWASIQTTTRLSFTPEYFPLALLQFFPSGVSHAWFASNFNSALAALSKPGDTGITWLGWMGAIDQVLCMGSATIVGLLLLWSSRSYQVNKLRMKWWISVGNIIQVCGMGFAVACIYIWGDVTVAKFGWSPYFTLVFFACLLSNGGHTFMETSYWTFNASFFSTLSGSANVGRVFWEGTGNMAGFLINTPLSLTPWRRQIYMIINITTSIATGLYFWWKFQVPDEYTTYPSIRQKFAAQVYDYESEALDVAQRESAAEVVREQKQNRADAAAIAGSTPLIIV